MKGNHKPSLSSEMNFPVHCLRNAMTLYFLHLVFVAVSLVFCPVFNFDCCLHFYRREDNSLGNWSSFSDFLHGCNFLHALDHCYPKIIIPAMCLTPNRRLTQDSNSLYLASFILVYLLSLWWCPFWFCDDFHCVKVICCCGLLLYNISPALNLNICIWIQ